MDGCNQATITGATFAFLKGVHGLNMFACGNKAAAARGLGLPVTTQQQPTLEGAFNFVVGAPD